jgi:secreted Zn-dependent insulinase-like peptidase
MTATLEDPSFLGSEMIQEMNKKTITLKEVLNAGKEALMGTCSIYSFIHGNIDEQAAKELSKTIITSLGQSCSGPNKDDNDEKSRKKIQSVDDATSSSSSSTSSVASSLHLPEPSPTNLNSAVSMQCQYGYEKEWGNLHDSMVLKVLKHMTDDQTYDVLRTKEHLGYIVWTIAERIHTVLSMSIVVESSEHDAGKNGSNKIGRASCRERVSTRV